MTITLNKTNKNYKRSQKGRSMVEMLGVLAVVGVLSVGGLNGYGLAMKKHKANELLHQASMLAITISAQAMTNDGKLPQTITSFGNGSYGTFSTGATDALGGKGFSITIENVDSAVCEQLEKMQGGIAQKIECVDAGNDKKNAKLTFYKNLATTEAEGAKSPTGGAGTEKDPACEGVECPEGTTCGVAGNCIAEKTTDGTCSNNSDCDEWCDENGGGEKCYCAISATRTGNDSACYNNFSGTCEKATIKSNSGGYLSTEILMNWWSAVNFCKAHNASLVSLADLGITGGYQEGGACGEGYDECLGPSGSFDWRSVEAVIDIPLFWVMDAVSCNDDTGECRAGSNNNSCRAFSVDVKRGIVPRRHRDFRSYSCSALCR